MVRGDDVQEGGPAHPYGAGASRNPRDLPNLSGGEALQPASSFARPGCAAGPGGGSRLIPIRALTPSGERGSLSLVPRLRVASQLRRPFGSAQT
jgi:hypothetical protein